MANVATDRWSRFLRGANVPSCREAVTLIVWVFLAPHSAMTSGFAGSSPDWASLLSTCWPRQAPLTRLYARSTEAGKSCSRIFSTSRGSESGVRYQPAADSLRDLRGCGFGHLGRVFSVFANPKPPTCGLPNQLDPVRFPATFLQTDPNVRWKPRHVFDPLDVASHCPMIEYGASS